MSHFREVPWPYFGSFGPVWGKSLQIISQYWDLCHMLCHQNHEKPSTQFFHNWAHCWESGIFRFALLNKVQFLTNKSKIFTWHFLLPISKNVCMKNLIQIRATKFWAKIFLFHFWYPDKNLRRFCKIRFFIWAKKSG